MRLTFLFALSLPLFAQTNQFDLRVGYSPFQVFWDGPQSCAGEMKITVKLWQLTKEVYEQDPRIDGSGLNLTLIDAWSALTRECRSSAFPSRLKVSMVAYGEEVRRGTISERPERLGWGMKYVEELKPNTDANPSNQPLDTQGLRFGSFFDGVFYGRFNQLQAGDRRQAEAPIFYAVTMRYGEQYRALLKDPLVEITRKIEYWENGNLASAKRVRYLVEQPNAPLLEKILAKQPSMGAIIPSLMAKDVQEMVSRNLTKNPLALRQYLDNLHRYLHGKPSLQSEFGTAAVGREK